MWIYWSLMLYVGSSLIALVMCLLRNRLKPKTIKVSIFLSISVAFGALLVILYKCFKYNWMRSELIFQHYLFFNGHKYLVGISFDGPSAIMLFMSTCPMFMGLCMGIKYSTLARYCWTALYHFVFLVFIFSTCFRVWQW